MKEIKLTQDKIALVDDADYTWLIQWKWYAHKGNGGWYAARRCRGGTIFMHNELCPPASKGIKVDHRNLNTLDNQRGNLRQGTHAQNKQNAPKHRDNRSGFKGVYFCKEKGKWAAQICIAGKQTHAGRFSSAEEAAQAYDRRAAEVFGEFAKLNFPISSPEIVK